MDWREAFETNYGETFIEMSALVKHQRIGMEGSFINVLKVEMFSHSHKKGPIGSKSGNR